MYVCDAKQILIRPFFRQSRIIEIFFHIIMYASVCLILKNIFKIDVSVVGRVIVDSILKNSSFFLEIDYISSFFHLYCICNLFFYLLYLNQTRCYTHPPFRFINLYKVIPFPRSKKKVPIQNHNHGNKKRKPFSCTYKLFFALLFINFVSIYFTFVIHTHPTYSVFFSSHF